jgi:hypothetical protein
VSAGGFAGSKASGFQRKKDGLRIHQAIISTIPTTRKMIARASGTPTPKRLAQVAASSGSSHVYELVGSGVEMIADRLHVHYRCTGLDDGQWYLIEQHLFATLSVDGIEHLDLVCSGFRDIPPPT